ncbi:hypothetical protein LEP1GSC193_2791 [Leptospira alstonii serovar Pingchang str. 80-412]|uniref:Uncharacterized protein n=2 Tax=Leptospira alstonii TaxID=28452 RepID=M6CJA3_9LEPT|nr:hypothetical protein LEP1GSC194_3103 [Leptospira alstonii serovar Sichuan str. 79601]EQA82112.1 hypothetical protein LEP1GSC193_2791 [Leptospira alstonii serovar Pingchang str. 80-412]
MSESSPSLTKNVGTPTCIHYESCEVLRPALNVKVQIL